MSEPEVVIRALGRPGDLGWVVMAHGEIYTAELGWNTNLEVLVARVVADYADGRDRREGAWIAEMDGRRVGCVLCVSDGEATAQLRTLLVDPAARGHHVGARLVDECLAFARQAGYARVKLVTTPALGAARGIYLSRGFNLMREEPHDSFGVNLVAQVYELDLDANPKPETANPPTGGRRKE